MSAQMSPTMYILRVKPDVVVVCDGVSAGVCDSECQRRGVSVGFKARYSLKLISFSSCFLLIGGGQAAEQIQCIACGLPKVDQRYFMHFWFLAKIHYQTDLDFVKHIFL